MKIQPISQNFKMPTKGSSAAGGYDLYMPHAGTVVPNAGEGELFGLGFKAALPEGTVALLLPRSGVGAKHGLELNNTCGVIDADYRGEWMVSLRTKNGVPFSWEEGERLVQMVVVKAEVLDLVQVDSLDETNRGEGGFGHTGK